MFRNKSKGLLIDLEKAIARATQTYGHTERRRKKSKDGNSDSRDWEKGPSTVTEGNLVGLRIHREVYKEKRSSIAPQVPWYRRKERKNNKEITKRVGRGHGRRDCRLQPGASPGSR